MLEQLRLNFKTRNNMNINENVDKIDTLNFINSIKLTHKNLAENGNNAFTI